MPEHDFNVDGICVRCGRSQVNSEYYGLLCIEKQKTASKELPAMKKDLGNRALAQGTRPMSLRLEHDHISFIRGVGLAWGSHEEVRFDQQGAHFSGLVVEPRWRWVLYMLTYPFFFILWDIIFGVPAIAVIEHYHLFDPINPDAVSLSPLLPAELLPGLFGIGVLGAALGCVGGACLLSRRLALRMMGTRKQVTLPFASLKRLLYNKEALSAEAKKVSPEEVAKEIYTLIFAGGQAISTETGDGTGVASDIRTFIVDLTSRIGIPIETVRSPMTSFPTGDTHSPKGQ